MVNQILQWSSKLDELYLRYVHRPIMNHPKTFIDQDDGIRPLGISMPILRASIVQYGRADFSTPFQSPQFGTISPTTKVLLYCFLNMRRHFWSNYATFNDNRPLLRPALEKQPPIIVDVGCGPGTVGLAFADFFGLKPFSYIGIDRAKPMTFKCRELLKAAKDSSLIHRHSTLRTTSNWERLTLAPDKNVAVLFNFSFFFASKTLSITDVKSLAKRIQQIKAKSPGSRFYINYTNSTYSKFSERYFRFLQFLGNSLGSQLGTQTVMFRPRRNTNPPITETYVRSFFELI